MAQRVSAELAESVRPQEGLRMRARGEAKVLAQRQSTEGNTSAESVIDSFSHFPDSRRRQEERKQTSPELHRREDGTEV